MHRLSTSFVLGYHGCDRTVGERLLRNERFRQSTNDYDWLGHGIYFWENNPLRALEFAIEKAERHASSIEEPFFIGAVISLGLCLDLTTTAGIEQVRAGYRSLVKNAAAIRRKLPKNTTDGLRRPLDCAVIEMLHKIRLDRGDQPIDTVKGVFIEDRPIYEGSGFHEKTHIQIAVCNPKCVIGVFRVPNWQLRPIGKL